MAWTDRYVSVDGAGAHDGTSEADAWNFAEMLAAYAAGHRVNIKQGVYDFGAATTSFATTMTEPGVVWFRGYSNTPGDLENDPFTEKPKLLWSTGSVSLRSFHHYSSLRFEGAPEGPLVNGALSQAFASLRRCHIVNTNNNAASVAMATGTGGCPYMDNCYLEAQPLATCVIQQNISPDGIFCCTIKGGQTGIKQIAGAGLRLYFCVFTGQALDCVETTANCSICSIGCTYYKPGRDCIRVGSTGLILALANIFSEPAGYGMNWAAGSQQSRNRRGYNTFHACGLGNENGFADKPDCADQSIAFNPFVNPAGEDFRLISSFVPVGFPGRFEGLLFSSFFDGGAACRAHFAAIVKPPLCGLIG